MIDEQKQRVNHYKKHSNIVWKVLQDIDKNLVLEIFVVFLFVIEYEFPVYRGNFVLNCPFLGRKSVRLREVSGL